MMAEKYSCSDVVSFITGERDLPSYPSSSDSDLDEFAGLSPAHRVATSPESESELEQDDTSDLDFDKSSKRGLDWTLILGQNQCSDLDELPETSSSASDSQDEFVCSEDDDEPVVQLSDTATSDSESEQEATQEALEVVGVVVVAEVVVVGIEGIVARVEGVVKTMEQTTRFSVI